MNQCVPSWDFDDNSSPAKIKFNVHSNSSNSLLPDVPLLDYEVTELTWENGQLAMHGLGVPRVVNKPTASSSAVAWDKPHAGGTLESIVNQATGHPQPNSAADGGVDNNNDFEPWFNNHRAVVNPGASASITMTMDALVPCNNQKDNQEPSTLLCGGMGISRAAGCSTRVGSCSVGAPGTLDGGGGVSCVARMGINSCKTNGSVNESATCGGRESHPVTFDTWDRELGVTSLLSPENTFSGQECTKTSADEHESLSRSRSQRKSGAEEGKRKVIGKSSVSTKRSRAAAIHNQSERKRRDKINQRMKTLQKLVPNSSKTDKASMLDEVIEYLKQLQAQVHMMNRMNMPSMMLPLAMQQQLQMSMMGMGMGMGMGLGVMDMNTINRAAAAAGVPPVVPPAAALMPVPSASWENPRDCLPVQQPAGPVMPDHLAAFLACHSQPMTMDAYSRLAAMYQQLQQPPVSKN